MVQGLQEVHGDIPGTTYAGVTRKIRSRSYYGADNRLRVFQESDLAVNSTDGDRGVWEEYRYDPLPLAGTILRRGERAKCGRDGDPINRSSGLVLPS